MFFLNFIVTEINVQNISCHCCPGYVKISTKKKKNFREGEGGGGD
jgi:hypothetical protein